MRLVILESPYAAETEEAIELHRRYARACMADCLKRGEAPYASHLLYTQPGVLDDKIPAERRLGINAGLEWGKVSEGTVVYEDLGISEGMQKGIDRAIANGKWLEYRKLGSW